MKITLCASCALGQGGFAADLADVLAQAGVAVEMAAVDCMSG